MHTEFIYLKDEELISQSGTGFWFGVNYFYDTGL